MQECTFCVDFDSDSRLQIQIQIQIIFPENSNLQLEQFIKNYLQ